MTVKLDCRNIDCPGPVLKTKQAIEEQAVTNIQVIVDTLAELDGLSKLQIKAAANAAKEAGKEGCKNCCVI